MESPTSVSEPSYRWVIVATAATMLALSMGLLVNGLSVFFVPLEAEFGWARGEIGLINSFGLVGLAIGGIVMGRVADRLDIRKVVLTGAIVTGSCMLAAGAADRLWQLYALFLIAGAFGGGALFGPLMTLVGGWFRQSAGLAIGIVAAGQAAGQGAVPLGSAALIEVIGWRGAFTVLGAGTLILLVPLALLIRRPPAMSSSAMPSLESERTLSAPVSVMAMGAAVLCCCSLMSVPLMHLVPMAQGCGFSATDAGGIMVALMLAAIFGRVAFGWVADRIGPISAWLLASAWQTSLVYVFTQLDTLQALLLFAPVYGFGYAGVMTGVLTTIRRVTPAASRATCTGFILAFAWAGHGLGGSVGGMFFDATLSYDLTFAVAALMGVANMFIVAGIALALRVPRDKLSSRINQNQCLGEPYTEVGATSHTQRNQTCGRYARKLATLGQYAA